MLNENIYRLFKEHAKVEGRSLVSACKAGEARSNEGFNLAEEVIFQFDAVSIVISIDPDTDELIVSYKGGNFECSRSCVNIFDNLIGRNLGWIWTGINNMGRRDLFLISFSGPSPDAMFIGEGGVIRISDLT